VTPTAYITTSWDDGHPHDFRIAEMLARHGLPGTFYIPREIPSGAMSEAQVRELSKSFEIGAHTLHHVDLYDTGDPTARQEIAGSKAWVEDVTGQPCPMFCPPRGHFRPAHRLMCEEAGYLGLRTVEFMSLDLPRPAGALRIMPTTLQAFPHGPVRYLRNFAKRFAPRNLALYVLRGRGNWEQAADRLLSHTLARGGVFHLWGHSWEIEEANLWEPLDRVLALMGQYAKQAATPTNGALCAPATIAASPSPSPLLSR